MAASDWLPWAAPVVTVLGWMVANHQANKRERRKELRSLLDSARRQLVELTAKARQYLAEDRRSDEVEADIKALLGLLEVDLERVPGYKDDTELVRAVARFADAATGGGFESSDKRASGPASAEAQELAAACVNLLGNMERRFRKTFPDSWRQHLL